MTRSSGFREGGVWVKRRRQANGTQSSSNIARQGFSYLRKEMNFLPDPLVLLKFVAIGNRGSVAGTDL
jgi:hypothetical protein